MSDNAPLAPCVFSLTAAGAELAQRLQQVQGELIHLHRPADFMAQAREQFSAGRRCIFICAAAIVVRALAPVLQDKYRDPAVLVLDERGEFIIPLLAGHEGGACAWGHDLAQAIGAQLVVTSASDYRQPVYCVGMGCERHCPISSLRSLWHSACAELNAPIASLASIDVKADEIGLIELAESLTIPYQTFPAAHLRSVEHLLSVKSDIVFREVGVYGVAEAAALLAASDITGNPAELVLHKQKNSQATIAIARSYR